MKQKILIEEIELIIHLNAIVDKYTHRILNTGDVAKLIVKFLKEEKLLK